MKHLIIIILLVFISSCTEQETNAKENYKIIYSKTTIQVHTYVRTIEQDSCQYILVNNSNDGVSIIHKNNCKYCIERNKKK